jgi:hypothetical protein
VGSEVPGTPGTVPKITETDLPLKRKSLQVPFAVFVNCVVYRQRFVAGPDLTFYFNADPAPSGSRSTTLFVSGRDWLSIA